MNGMSGNDRKGFVFADDHGVLHRVAAWGAPSGLRLIFARIPGAMPQAIIGRAFSAHEFRPKGLKARTNMQARQ